MKTNLVKAALALTLISLTAPVTAHQFSTVELVTSGNVPDQKVSASTPDKNLETTAKVEKSSAKEYVISTVTQPSLEAACTTDDVFTVTLVLLENNNGELRMYDADANLLGNQLVTLDQEDGITHEKSKVNKPVSKLIAPIDLERKKVFQSNQKPVKAVDAILDIERKKVFMGNPNLISHKVINPMEGQLLHPKDPIIIKEPLPGSGDTKYLMCLALNRDLLNFRQIEANMTCRDITVKLSCPQLDIFTKVALRSRCNIKSVGNLGEGFRD